MGPADNLLAFACRQYRAGTWRDLDDTMAREERVVLRLEGREPRELWAYPHDLETLALGHALLEMCAPGTAPVLAGGDGRTFRMTAGPRPETGAAPPRPLAPDEVLATMESLFAMGGLWQDTGCFHRAGLYDPAAGGFAAVAQDIGRHNCLDRLAGWTLAAGRDPAGLVLFVSARCTASLVAKALKLGIPLAVSRSAVTLGAVDLARQAGLGLAGFCREGRFTVFHDAAGRIAP